MTHNPFSVSRISAGQLRFRYPPEFDPDHLVKKFSEQGNWGTLIGPHGVGKTTLALDLARHFREHISRINLATIRKRPTGWFVSRICKQVDFQLETVTFHGGGTIDFSSQAEFQNWRAFRRFLRSSCNEGQELWIVDGIEQLSLMKRTRLIGLLKNRRAWSIITLHSQLALGVPVLWELQPNPENLVELATELLEGYPFSISRTEICEVIERVSGNPRQAFDRLYDLYETKSSTGL